MRPLLPLVVLAACTGAPTDDDALGTCEAGPRRTGVITTLRFSRPDEQGRIAGFDLDETVTAQGDPTGCALADDVSPDGTPGVDAAFAKLLPALELTEAAVVEEILQDVINNGELLVIWDLVGLDDPTTDTCATLNLLQAEGPPIVGVDDRINADQTFDVSPDTPVVQYGEVQIVDGTFQADDFAFDLPFSFLEASLLLHLENVSVRVTMHEDGTFTGMLGGGIVVADMLAELNDTGIASEVKALLAAAVGGVADMAPVDGLCTQLSVALTFEGVGAHLYADPAVDTGAAE